MNILTPYNLVVFLFTTALICIISSPAESKEPLAAYLPSNVLFSIEVENFEELKKISRKLLGMNYRLFRFGETLELDGERN